MPKPEVMRPETGATMPATRLPIPEASKNCPSLPQPATPAPASDSWTGWLLESLSGIVTIRDIGESDWPLLAEKAAALAESGDLTQAIAIVDAAEGTKPVPLSQWRDQAAARLALEAALVQVSDSVMRQISAAGGMQ